LTVKKRNSPSKKSICREEVFEEVQEKSETDYYVERDRKVDKSRPVNSRGF
jgi:sRNA-binding carbon storage regulator CsrA